MSMQATCHPDRKAVGRGLCSACWQRHRKAGTLPDFRIRQVSDAAITHKKCNLCGFESDNPREDFYFSEKSGKFRHCKRCTRARTAARYARIKDDGTYKTEARWVRLRKVYGVSPQDYDRMMEEQGHRCAICGKHKDECAKPLEVDHCHDLGHVRGLLCNPCNLAIGLFKNNPETLASAIKYLTSTKLGPIVKSKGETDGD